MEWIKVEDCLPEPGVPVLVFVQMERYRVDCSLEAKYTRRLRAMWIPKWTVEAGDSGSYEYSEEKDEYYIIPGWYERNEFEEEHWKIEGKVTHWMPLPEPPA